MGVPKYARGWTLKDIEYQNDIELDQRFRDRVMSHVRLYGVPRHNEESVRAAVRWLDYLRGQDAENSAVGLYIHGPVGTGKTLLAAILCRALMGGVERVWTRYSDAYIARSLGRTPTPEDLEDPMWQGYAAARSMPVMWVSEGEIMRRQKLSWKGDESPLLQVSTFKGLVIYDEAGAETASTSGRVPEWKIEAFERMITRRIDRGSPLLLTSNIPARVGFGQVEGKSSPWGARVADRLRGSVVPLALKGSSWRQV
jgi:DNA replication protein DnaC